MKLTELRNYEKWIGKSPGEIRQHVLAAGGWSAVFPVGHRIKDDFSTVAESGAAFPVWASKVRNYFNETPRYLKLLSKAAGEMRKDSIENRYDAWVGLHKTALSGEVYHDECGRSWFQMSPGGTVYHYAGEPGKMKSARAQWNGQASTPVFKLVSPDGTGGSMELCVLNPQVKGVGGSPTIGTEAAGAIIVARTEWTEAYQGTYNYAETVVRGYPEHKHMDMDSHSAAEGFYLNPEQGRYSVLSDRRFPVMKKEK